MSRKQDKKDELDIAEQKRDYEEQASLVDEGLTRPRLGPSDSSDSGSDLAPITPDTDSDRANTGERAEVENDGDGPGSEDVLPDRIVPEDDAGLAYSRPKPERNGGQR